MVDIPRASIAAVTTRKIKVTFWILDKMKYSNWEYFAISYIHAMTMSSSSFGNKYSLSYCVSSSNEDHVVIRHIPGILYIYLHVYRDDEWEVSVNICSYTSNGVEKLMSKLQLL